MGQSFQQWVFITPLYFKFTWNNADRFNSFTFGRLAGLPCVLCESFFTRRYKFCIACLPFTFILTLYTLPFTLSKKVNPKQNKFEYKIQ